MDRFKKPLLQGRVHKHTGAAPFDKPLDLTDAVLRDVNEIAGLQGNIFFKLVACYQVF